MTRWLIKWDSGKESWYVIPQYLSAECYKIYAKDKEAASSLKEALEKYQNNEV